MNAFLPFWRSISVLLVLMREGIKGTAWCPHEIRRWILFWTIYFHSRHMSKLFTDNPSGEVDASGLGQQPH
jgi:hypothetical protein